MAEAKYMLDTNICIYMLKNNPPAVLKRFSECLDGEVTISAIVWAELCCGKNKDASALLDALYMRLNPRPFDSDAALKFGQLAQNHPEKKNTFDRLIAAHAISLGLTLVTNNPGDFSRYQQDGLRLENWAA